MISIGQYEDRLPDIRDFADLQHFHRYLFDDIEDFDQLHADTLLEAGWLPPSEQQLRELYYYAVNTSVNLLIHCHAGVSRSTAVAFLRLVNQFGLKNPEKPQEERFQMAWDELMLIRPQAQPNIYMIKIFDDYSGHGGAITRFAANKMNLNNYNWQKDLFTGKELHKHG